MADFKAQVVRLTIEEHPNADALEIARVGDYKSIVRKGQFQTGDLGVYIPEQAVLPVWLIKELGLEGKLAGKQQNRVKAVKLRGVLSQGLIYPVELMWNTFGHEQGHQLHVVEDGADKRLIVTEGQDVTEVLGIVKWEPEIPSHMNGQLTGAAGCTLKYDIENIKRYPDVFEENELVVITEKLHGTWACFGYHPRVDHPIVTSKGLSGKGLIFKWAFPENENNLYIQAFQRLTYRDSGNTLYREGVTGTSIVQRVHEALNLDRDTPVYVLGEIYGKGVQDLHYGAQQPQFRIFDVYVGQPGNGEFVSPGSMKAWIEDELGLEHVPVLYVGPYDREIVDELTDGLETVGGGMNIREGVVIKPMIERRDDEIGRVVLKSVSEDYLMRKGGTELT